MSTDNLPVVGINPRKGETYVWTMTDGALVYLRVTRVYDGVAWLRCHHAGRSWTRRHQLPLFPSMEKREWTTAELLETIT
jgi:hypothetical protein